MTFGAFVKHFEICGQKGCVRVVITSEKEKTVKLKFEVILICPFLFLLGFFFFSVGKKQNCKLVNLEVANSLDLWAKK